MDSVISQLMAKKFDILMYFTCSERYAFVFGHEGIDSAYSYVGDADTL